MKILSLAEFRKKSVMLLLVLFMAGSLTAGCTTRSHSYDKSATTDATGQTVVVEEHSSTTSESHDHGPGLLGGTFHLVGEILAFPFEVVAGVFRFIF